MGHIFKRKQDIYAEHCQLTVRSVALRGRLSEETNSVGFVALSGIDTGKCLHLVLLREKNIGKVVINLSLPCLESVGFFDLILKIY